MGLTRDQIASFVRQNLNDLGITFFTANDINASIQEGYSLTTAVTRCIEKTITVPFQSRLVYYNFRKIIPDYLNISRIYNQNSKAWLEGKGRRFGRNCRSNWETEIGQPAFYIPYSYEYVVIFPHQFNAVGSMDIFYNATANILQPDSIPDIPYQYEGILENYATADLLEQIPELQKAQPFWAEYIKERNELKQFIKDRMRQDITRSL
jgi:hypothetical protein